MKQSNKVSGIVIGSNITQSNNIIHDCAVNIEDYAFNIKHNNFHSKNLIIKQNGELYINGEKQPKIPKLFGGEYVVQDCGKVYINGREKKNGEWKLTLRAIAACLFG